MWDSLIWALTVHITYYWTNYYLHRNRNFPRVCYEFIIYKHKHCIKRNTYLGQKICWFVRDLPKSELESSSNFVSKKCCAKFDERKHSSLFMHRIWTGWWNVRVLTSFNWCQICHICKILNLFINLFIIGHLS